MRQTYSDVPTDYKGGQQALKALRAERPKTMGGRRTEPFAGPVEEIAQELEKARGTKNVATIHEQLKKLGPLTRHGDGKIRGDAKQVAGIYMDVLETAPEAADAIKAANQRWKREEALKDMNEWLEPNHGVISAKRGVDTINPDAFLGKFRKERSDSKLFRDAFTDEEAATIESNMRALAAKTLPPPGPKGPVAPRPALLPGGSPPPAATGEALPGAVDERFTKGLAEAPGLQKPPGLPEGPPPTKLPEPPVMADAPKEVPPIYPEFPDPGKPAGLTVPLTPPANVPPEPASTTIWYPEPLKKGEWIRKRPPQEGQWTREQWETYAKEALKKKPAIWRELVGAGAAGGLAYGLQRMGFSPAMADVALYTVAGGIATSAIKGKGNWLMSKALLNDTYRPLLQEALMDGGKINPLFYNAMLAALTPEDKAEYEREQRTAQQKVRR